MLFGNFEGFLEYSLLLSAFMLRGFAEGLLQGASRASGLLELL